MNLIVVESPSKAKTIEKFLGKDFQVAASAGHIKDLPKKSLGVDILHDFAPRYEWMPDKKKYIENIRRLARQAEQVYIATDPDREGEAIAAHVAEIVADRHPQPKRALFYEITCDAVQRAVSKPEVIDKRKVNAQIARRVMDRLVGYKVSPLIWKTVAKGLSAGRVQSVALRLICEREEEITSFKKQEYWTIHALFSGESVKPFSAELIAYQGKKPKLPDKAAADEIVGAIRSYAEHGVLNESHLERSRKFFPFSVRSVKKTRQSTKPLPPYTTSTLQQDAARRLRFSSKRTMALAQMLYEGVELPDGETSGLITYMRTDSVRVASEAIKAVRGLIKERIGDGYLSPKERHYRRKGRTQDAHEAIRPTDIERTPESLKGVLESSLWKLYDLIWRRFVATQMADSLTDVTVVEIEGGEALFRARGQKRVFDGFQKIYPLDNGDDGKLPDLPKDFASGFPLLLDKVEGKQHFTQPPPRYTEATLVKTLDELGIGRPSTYASIITTLFDRKYIQRQKRALSPTELGKTVNGILVRMFPDIFEVGFTAWMEERLDQVEEGGDWVPVVREFYEPFARDLEEAEKRRTEIKKQVQEDSGETCEKCGEPMIIKWGRRGKFLACSGFPKCRNTRALEEPEKTGALCPECGGELLIKAGRYGRFAGCSNFPQCRYVEPIKTGVKCPKPGCDGELVEKASKRGRFWACSNYPKCKFRVYKQPVPVTCDNCGHPFMVLAGSAGEGGDLICPRCEHTVEKAPEPTALPAND